MFKHFIKELQRKLHIF